MKIFYILILCVLISCSSNKGDEAKASDSSRVKASDAKVNSLAPTGRLKDVQEGTENDVDGQKRHGIYITLDNSVPWAFVRGTWTSPESPKICLAIKQIRINPPPTFSNYVTKFTLDNDHNVHFLRNPRSDQWFLYSPD